MASYEFSGLVHLPIAETAFGGPPRSCGTMTFDDTGISLILSVSFISIIRHFPYWLRASKYYSRRNGLTASYADIEGFQITQGYLVVKSYERGDFLFMPEDRDGFISAVTSIPQVLRKATSTGPRASSDGHTNSLAWSLRPLPRRDRRCSKRM
jgi:hypothetical protein